MCGLCLLAYAILFTAICDFFRDILIGNLLLYDNEFFVEGGKYMNVCKKLNKILISKMRVCKVRYPGGCLHSTDILPFQSVCVWAVSTRVCLIPCALDQ